MQKNTPQNTFSPEQLPVTAFEIGENVHCVKSEQIWGFFWYAFGHFSRSGRFSLCTLLHEH